MKRTKLPMTFNHSEFQKQAYALGVDWSSSLPLWMPLVFGSIKQERKPDALDAEPAMEFDSLDELEYEPISRKVKLG